jgi:uncharacterized protein (TIGR00730 family)
MTPQAMKHICVFCGANTGSDPLYVQVATEVGRYIAEQRYTLVYGAGNVGLMGVIADAVMAHGGQTTGVIPEFLQKWEVAHDNLDELIITQTMHERKAIMAERADAFVALPGGYGTLDELFEILTWRQLHLHQKPIGLLNVKGYFDPLLQMVDRMKEEGFLQAENHQLILSANTVGDLFAQLSQQAAQLGSLVVDTSKV